MKERIELPQEVCGIIEVLEAHGFEAYAVGGAVRDMLIGVPPGDFDVTTSAQPEEVKEILWLSEMDALRALTYDSDRGILRKAAEFLRQQDLQKGV